MLKGREVDDVRRTSIVHEDSFGIESSYVQHYNQQVVVRLLHSSGISLIEGHVLVCPSMFERWSRMDTVHLFLACFLEGSERPSSDGTTCNCLYFPDDILGGLVRMNIVPGREFPLTLAATLEVTALPLLHVFL